MLQLSLLALAALVTSIISGIIGMGGGIMLLAVMLSFLSHADTIPAHGAVQLVSNGTRLLAFVRHVDWRTTMRFAIGAVPGSALGGLLLIWIRRDNIEATEPYFKIAIGIYVLIMVLKPLGRSSPRDSRLSPGENRRFMIFGFLAGGLGLTIGAIGPLIAPAFIHCGFVKERLVATKAVCQAIIHLLKIPVFVGAGLVAYAKLAQVIVIMSLMVIPGTLIGKRILNHVNERAFVKIFRLAMFLAGLKVLLHDGIYQLVWGT